MRIMGIDYGDRRIGIALSDALGWTAQGLETIIWQREITLALDRIKELAQNNEVTKIVVGLPRHLNGEISQQGEKTLAFVKQLHVHTGLPVETWDERLTTMAAERLLISADVRRNKRRQVIDKVAAAIILQGYLDAQSTSQRG